MTLPNRPTRSAPRHSGFFLRLVNKRLAQAVGAGHAHSYDNSQPATFVTLAEALKAFFGWLDYPDFATHYCGEFDQVVNLIAYSDLSKGFIKQLALDIRTALKLPQSAGVQS